MKRLARASRTAILCVALASPAAALPLGLPGPPLPSLPGPIGGRVGETLGTVDGPVSSLRRDLVGRPLAGSRTFDRDTSGARVLRREILAIAPSDGALAAAKAAGFEVLRTDTLGTLGLAVTVLRSPSSMSTTEALNALRAADPAGSYDYDHVYDPAGEASATAASLAPPSHSAAGPFGAIGMIDGGIDRSHPVFADAAIVVFDSASKSTLATAHGTAVASLLVGSRGGWRGAAPGAKLYAADVFGGAADGGSADAIARGLAWLAGSNVAVINVSLSGPRNALVGAAVKALLAKGIVVVAAAGNDGPAVPVSFPAAVEGVVAVTSVDAANRIQLDANRGSAVMFASIGVDVRAAKPGGGFAHVTGTSFAAPVVTANFASLMHDPGLAAARDAKTKLEAAAQDLGTPGRDPVYGYGFLGYPSQTTSPATLAGEDAPAMRRGR